MEIPAADGGIRKRIGVKWESEVSVDCKGNFEIFEDAGKTGDGRWTTPVDFNRNSLVSATFCLK